MSGFQVLVLLPPPTKFLGFQMYCHHAMPDTFVWSDNFYFTKSLLPTIMRVRVDSSSLEVPLALDSIWKVEEGREGLQDQPRLQEPSFQSKQTNKPGRRGGAEKETISPSAFGVWGHSCTLWKERSEQIRWLQQDVWCWDHRDAGGEFILLI